MSGERANDPDRFDRLPATDEQRRVPERFGIGRRTFADHSFWERGRGKIWVCAGTEPSPAAVEALGMTFLRTRQEFWKPTMAAVQRFGHRASRNVCHLDRERARRFVAGEEQDLDWDGDWGYLIVTHEVAVEPEPLGVGLFTYGTLRSQVPKGRRREL